MKRTMYPVAAFLAVVASVSSCNEQSQPCFPSLVSKMPNTKTDIPTDSVVQFLKELLEELFEITDAPLDWNLTTSFNLGSLDALDMYSAIDDEYGTHFSSPYRGPLGSILDLAYAIQSAIGGEGQAYQEIPVDYTLDAFLDGFETNTRFSARLSGAGSTRAIVNGSPGYSFSVSPAGINGRHLVVNDDSFAASCSNDSLHFVLRLDILLDSQPGIVASAGYWTVKCSAPFNNLDNGVFSYRKNTNTLQ